MPIVCNMARSITTFYFSNVACSTFNVSLLSVTLYTVTWHNRPSFSAFWTSNNRWFAFSSFVFWEQMRLALKSSLRSSRFLSFSGRRDRTSERAPGISKNCEKRGKGEREGEEDGEKRYRLHSQSQTFYRTPFVHERRAIVQFDWSVPRQSKSDIRN